MRSNGISESIEKILESFGPNATYVWDVLQEYLENPQAVDEPWREYFSGLPGIEGAAKQGNGSRQEHRADAESTPAAPAPQRPPQTPPEVTAIKGVAARIVENMEASLSLPTATSLRVISAKILEENRKLLNQYLSIDSRRKISFTHIIAWAIVRSLERFPNLNASFMRVEGEPFRDTKSTINIGIAIDMTRKDGTRTLLVPNIKNVGELNFAGFVEAYDTLVRRAQSSSLDPADFQGTSITLTNPGTVGTISSIPRLMPGQGAIIATGNITYPATYEGMAPRMLSTLGVSKIMNITCTYDHRVIQGAESGQFLGQIHRLLLGEESFYDLLFADLKIPYEPLRWAIDQNPAPVEGVTHDHADKHGKVLQLLNAYRVRGHLIAHLNPLRNEPQHHPELDPGYYGLTLWDLDRRFHAGAIEGMETATLREMLDTMRATYCSTIGVEYMFNQDPGQKRWLQMQMEPTRNQAPLTADEKKNILAKLIQAESFERFLHTKFVGHKRFSLEGGETLIPILDAIFRDLVAQEAERVVIGMAHRGRLNVLANTIGKPLARIFSEFEGSIDPESTQGTGDVKYHLGASGKYISPEGKQLTIDLAPNPSHLESVNPVVEGITHAIQNRRGDEKREQVLPILIHGDAAFAGQGVIAETLNLSQLKGYRTGGTIHIIIDNQIGFTTSPDDARSTPYCTDVAKMVQAPIFHVNGDDPEASVRVARLALAYRQRFKRDVVIDMFCYRRYGHNEGDEPSYTQPLMYKTIKQHPSVREIYAEKLLRDGVISTEETKTLLEHASHRLERAFEASQKRELPFRPDIPLAVSAEELHAAQPPNGTAVEADALHHVASRLVAVPEDFHVHPKLTKFLEARSSLREDEAHIDWSFAEALAFGSLVMEGTPVRLSGQDSARGTFSQRHAILYDAVTGEEYVPLNNIREEQAKFSVYDSLLSEAAVLGFEFGYSVANPLTLVLWEAQFGDFSNAAQVIIDQYIAGSEVKWQQPSDLVLLLPHGYEGQGPEHSSARLERFLQLCAEENMQVCNVSTPAQYFHVLRRQMRDNKRIPLILMTPKSLLRHPMVVSAPSELVHGAFHEVLDEPEEVNPAQVQRLLLCSGKIYYDLLHARREKKLENIPIIRLEQLYPYPQHTLKEILAKYRSASGILWVQEEPENMGAWTFIRPRLENDLADHQHLRYCGRPASASPATGSLKRHIEHQERIIREALGE